MRSEVKRESLINDFTMRRCDNYDCYITVFNNSMSFNKSELIVLLVMLLDEPKMTV